MLNLLKKFFDIVDVPKIVDFQRNRNNRAAAARLFLGLATAYDINEIGEVLLDELEAALASHRRTERGDSFTLNLYRVRALLAEQADNLDQLDTLFRDMYSELRLLSPDFEPTYSAVFPGKYSALMDAQMLLSDARLPIHEDHPFPPTDEFERPYRTLWFSPAVDDDRERTRRLLHGDCGVPKQVIDVHPSDGEQFFRELDRYFREERPRKLLDDLKEAAERYRAAMERNLSLSDVLAEIGSIRKRSNWGRSYLERDTKDSSAGK